jgi:hypothetical protein
MLLSVFHCNGTAAEGAGVAIRQALGSLRFYNGLPCQTSLNAANTAAFGGAGFERRFELCDDDGGVI